MLKSLNRNLSRCKIRTFLFAKNVGNFLCLIRCKFVRFLTAKISNMANQITNSLCRIYSNNYNIHLDILCLKIKSFYYFSNSYFQEIMYNIVINLIFISPDILYFYQGSVISIYNFNIASIANSGK